ncbi:hypothetical protein GGR56DRAFT_644561 [Xylariaceae sp. FL0804]|nr:hypothetical protein GGR56DRAFT_644561 [Xylariaceae sp. FL0804]
MPSSRKLDRGECARDEQDSPRSASPTPYGRLIARHRNIKQACIHGLAIIGLAYLVTVLPGSLRNTVTSFRYLSTSSAGLPDPYPDTDYPLRRANEPWDISVSYPYSRNLSKTVSEGTWLRLTTHPSLAEIVFDMLGDLYCMSTSKADPTFGSAYAILSGIPFDKEAEFSPDGSRLVFISDAGFGVDNLWTMPYTTCAKMAAQTQQEARTSAVQQTNATFRFFSSPAFHPTEPRLVATKWYLTGRPNGAGEIWEFPLLEYTPDALPEIGGRRLVSRELPASWPAERYFESQLGAEQARYTPKGDGIVFTRNAKDRHLGKFSYNKDVHAGINAVYCLNLTTGQSTELVAAAASEPNKPASPGGANMARMSHDGQTLAFVRRVDDKSVLVLKDMRSGTIHYVWDGLTYDLSMIPAFMGAYPNYGWSANDASVIIWAQGQIWEIPVAFDHLGERIARGLPEYLPFSASVELALGETLYSETPLQVTEQALRSRVLSLRSLRSNLFGSSVVFEAAGDNYLIDLESQEQLPLPKPQEYQSCYAPSFVTGTQLTLQACWDEANLTQLYVADSRREVVSEIVGIPRGRYVSPVSDGVFLAYVRTGKDYLFGDVEETFGEGVWISKLHLPPGPDEEVRATGLRRISSLSSSQDTKLELRTYKGRPVLIVQNPSAAVEFDIENGLQRLLAKSPTSVEMAVLASGTGATLAFRDFQHVWLSEDSGVNALDVWSKPGDERTPDDLVRLSEYGGHDVAISGNGEAVFWLHGPTLHYVRVADVRRACSGTRLELRDSGECVSPVVSTREIHVTYETALSHQLRASDDRPFAVVNASLMAMDPNAPRLVPNATILVRGGVVVSIGPGRDVEVPPAAETLDAGGGAVIPGFVDVHGHWGGFLSPYPMHSWEMETFLGYGVTTIHNPASRNVGGWVERHLIEKGRMYGPRVFHTGDVLYGSTQPSVYTEINSRADAKAALARIKAEGGDASFSVKNYQLAARSARQRLLLEAADLHMLIVPEGGWSLDWDLTYFIDGYTSLEHPVPVPELYDDVLSLIAASGSSYTPLAVMNYGGIFGQHWIHQTHDIPGDQKLRRYVKHDILESLTEVKQAPRSSYQFFNTTRSTAKLAARGVRTNVGAHGEQPIGFLYHSEMRMMAMGGQSPYEVLQHATLGGATSLGLQQSIGSLEQGKLADLVIYPHDVNDIDMLFNLSMHMKYVMRGGTLFSVEGGLEEVWPQRGRRQPKARINPDDTP